MCVWRKTPNLLRLRPLGAGIAAALALAFLQEAQAGKSEAELAQAYRDSISGLKLSAEFKTAAEGCLKTYLDQFKDLKVKGKGMADFDPKAACPTNHNGGHLTNHNKSGAGTVKEVKIGGESVKVTYGEIGHCEATYEAMKQSFAALVKARGVVCKDIFQNINTRSGCMAKSGQTNCDTAYLEVAQELDTGRGILIVTNRQAQEFVKKFPEENEKAEKKYKEDREKIRAFEASHPAAFENVNRLGLLNKIELAPGDHVDPQNGGVPTIGDYLQRLDGGMAKHFSLLNLRVPNPSAGPLITEHELARKKAVEFQNALDKVRSEDDEMFALLSGKVREYKGSDTGTDDWYKHIPGAAGPLAGLINQNPQTGRPGVSGLGGGAALLAAGVAGASIGRASLPGAQSQLPQSPATPTATPEGTNLLASAAPPAAGGTAAPALPGATDNAPQTVADAGPNTFIPPGSNFLSAGASSKGKFKRPPPRTPASNGAATTASEGGDEMFKPFQADLRPSPAAKKSDGMGEVSSLLGQMKNLFNFEEGMGIPGPAGNPYGGSGAPGGGGGPAAGPYSEDYASEDYESSTGAEAPGEVQASGAIGSSGTSLFKRVHSRHRICMEKGWVLSGIGGIPE